MKTIIIPERTYNVFDWVYWIYQNQTIAIILGLVLFVLFVFLLSYLTDKYKGDP